MVVEVGFTLGLAEVEVKPLGLDDQEYVTPVTVVEPIEVELPVQMLASAPADLVGSGLTVIITESVLLHPVEVMVSVK